MTDSETVFPGEAATPATPDAARPVLRLDQYLKFTGRARSGGAAKFRIQAGEVSVNGTVETRRSRKLVRGDRVTLGGETFEVEILP
mgnify:CR=1 FL=1